MDKYFITPVSLQNNTFSTLFVGRNVVTLERIDSTNNYLKNQLSKSAPLPEGTVIMAEEQFAGRGQVDNIWLSEPKKNLTFSLLLFPTFLSPDLQFMLNKAISIGINDALNEIIGGDVKIKWPNDIYFKNKKLGGVLIENIVRGSTWVHAIIGVGLNVNQTEFSSNIENVTSLKKILHQDYYLSRVLQHLCKSIESRYLQLSSGEFDTLDNLYIQSLYKFGEKHMFETRGERVEGRITGIHKQGMLEVDIAGKSYTFNLKEITFVNQ